MELQINCIHIVFEKEKKIIKTFLICCMLASNILYVDNVQLPSLISQKNIVTEPTAEEVITQ
jgi:hypothetical protein